MKHKHSIARFFILAVGTILICTNAFSYICGNGAGGVYDGGGSSGSSTSLCMENNTIEYYIKLGGGYYFNANSSIQRLLRIVEWQDIEPVNFSEMKYAVENALVQLKNAKFMYELLIMTAENTPYKDAVLAELKTFDYDTFLKDNELNPHLFDNVRQHLQNGDITGIFKDAYNNQKKIITVLEAVKKEVYNNRIPGISLLWQINEALAAASLTGSYVARVCAAVQ